ncbi:MAG TPA: precorrin-8X methylmutase, partial [Bacillota bacterium]|nr:precorrin-8X methylmutase [Bacillota bacterium]
MNLENVLPEDIERRSFEIIESELPHPLDPALAPIIKRVIHTTADFEFADSLFFSENAVPLALKALGEGATIVTDTNMARAGINRQALASLGCRAVCFMADPDVAVAAREQKTTRASASIDKAADL